MTLNEYMLDALRTAPEIKITESSENGRVRSARDLDIGGSGLMGESAILRHVHLSYDIHGRPIDWDGVIESAGEALWYLTLIARAAGVTMEEIAARHLARRKARQPVMVEGGASP